jgi:hypothetical protein
MTDLLPSEGRAGGRWGEGRCPGLLCWQGDGQGQAASSGPQSFGVVNPTARGTERGVDPERAMRVYAPSIGESKRRRSDPWLDRARFTVELV